MVGVRAFVPNPALGLPQRDRGVSLLQARAALEMNLMTQLTSSMINVDTLAFIIVRFPRSEVKCTEKLVARYSQSNESK